MQDRKKRSPPATGTQRAARYLTAARQLSPHRLRRLHAQQSPFRPPPQGDRVAAAAVAAPRDGYHVHRSRQRADILERLHVPGPEEGPPLLPVAEGRPVKERLDITRYVADVRGNLVTRLKAGYLEDEALLLEERWNRDAAELEASRAALRAYAASFDRMMAASHDESMAVMIQHDEGAALLRAVLDQHRDLHRRLSGVRARIYVLSDSWARCNLYQAFLHQASPVAWVQEHGIRTRDSDSGVAGQPGEDSLELLITKFSADLMTEARPQLYFTEPQQLLELFKDVEHKNLDSLLHLESLSKSLEDMQRVSKHVEDDFHREINSVRAVVSELKTAIEWEEQRASELERHARSLISTTFKDLVVSDDLLKLRVFVEDAYEAVIAKNEGNLKMIDMLAAVEARYDQLMLQLDRFPRSLVDEVQAQVLAEDSRKMRASQDAAIKAQLVDKLIRRLQKALEPPPLKVGKPIHFRSPPAKAMKKPKPKAKELTQKQKDFLEFFTDYCQYTDSVATYISDF